jgi:hypothetical protein
VRGEEAEAGFARVKPWREPGVFPSGGMECKGSEEQLGAAPGEGSPGTRGFGDFTVRSLD